MGLMLRQDKDQHHQVQQGWRNRRKAKPAPRIQHARQVRGDGHTGQVRHGQLGQDHGKLELFRIGDIARIHDDHQPRHGQLGGNGQDDGRRCQGGHSVSRELVRNLFAIFAQGFGIGRNKGGGKGPLSKDPPKEVGEGQRCGIGIPSDRGAGANAGRDDQIARQTHEPADQGQARIDQGRAHQARPGLGGGRFRRLRRGLIWQRFGHCAALRRETCGVKPKGGT